MDSKDSGVTADRQEEPATEPRHGFHRNLDLAACKCGDWHTIEFIEREAQGEQPAPLDAALAALDRLYDAATVEEEDVSPRTHDELVAALNQAGAVLRGHPVPAPLDVCPDCGLTAQRIGQIHINAQRALSNQPSTEPAQGGTE